MNNQTKPATVEGNAPRRLELAQIKRDYYQSESQRYARALIEIEHLLDCGNRDESHLDDALGIARKALGSETEETRLDITGNQLFYRWFLCPNCGNENAKYNRGLVVCPDCLSEVPYENEASQ